MTTLSYIRNKVDTLCNQCDHLTTDKIKERLEGISNDIKEVSGNIAKGSRIAWNYTGLKEDEYSKWYWDKYAKDILSGDKEIAEAYQNGRGN